VITYRAKVQFKLSDKAFEGHGVGDDKNDPRSSSEGEVGFEFCTKFQPYNKRFRREEGVSSDC
jgi:hypothetical protein